MQLFERAISACDHPEHRLQMAKLMVTLHRLDEARVHVAKARALDSWKEKAREWDEEASSLLTGI